MITCPLELIAAETMDGAFFNSENWKVDASRIGAKETGGCGDNSSMTFLLFLS